MATAGDASALYESGGAGEKLRKGPVRTDGGGNSATTGISELEQMLKQVTITRSKIQHPTTTMENLPDELLINIFIRLFAKQLAQMRCVSKSWNVLLSHPSFVKSHLHRSIRKNNEQILLVFPGYEPITQYSCKSLHLEPTSVIKHTPVDLPIVAIGSVNGLICYSDFSYSNICIWNPSLSAVSAIPPPRSSPTNTNYAISFRFGFEPKSDDYKLVKISGIRGGTTRGEHALRTSVKEWLQVEVYRMRKRSWEFITQPFPSHIIGINHSDYLCVDGHDGYLHWETETDVKTEEPIVAFDLGSETFHEIPLPHSILDSNHRLRQLGVLGGKLCEMTWCDDGAWEVWVMEEYGVPESWVKRHVFPQFNDGVFLYGFTSRKELVLMDKEDRLVLYDPIANKIKKTRTQQEAYGILEYVDSLVWI